MPLQPSIKAWQPPAGVTAHDQGPLDDSWIFFVAPPSDIGPILTAQSTMVAGPPANPTWQRFLPYLATVPFLLAAIGVFFMQRDLFFELPVAIIAMVVGAFVFFYIRFKMRYRQVCSYTGGFGVARYTLSKSPSAPPIKDYFLFENARQLLASCKAMHMHGFYSGTSYSFIWYDEKNLVQYQCKGTHNSSKNKPPGKNPYWFGVAAEAAWTHYQSVILLPELDNPGFISFVYGKVNVVRVGPGFLEFIINEQTHRIDAAEIKHIHLKNNILQLQRKDAKLLGSDGKFKIDLATLANSRLFLQLVKELTGHDLG